MGNPSRKVDARDNLNSPAPATIPRVASFPIQLGFGYSALMISACTMQCNKGLDRHPPHLPFTCGHRPSGCASLAGRLHRYRASAGTADDWPSMSPLQIRQSRWMLLLQHCNLRVVIATPCPAKLSAMFERPACRGGPRCHPDAARKRSRTSATRPHTSRFRDGPASNSASMRAPFPCIWNVHLIGVSGAFDRSIHDNATRGLAIGSRLHHAAVARVEKAASPLFCAFCVLRGALEPVAAMFWKPEIELSFWMAQSKKSAPVLGLGLSHLAGAWWVRLPNTRLASGDRQHAVLSFPRIFRPPRYT